MGSKLRQEDVRIADLVSEFLDKHFYSKYTSGFERVNDRARQVVGIDTIFDYNGIHYVCDEKNGGTRINTNLRTFSLELSFINRVGERMDGWFVNKKLVNDTYMFIWVDGADSDKPVSSDEIREVEIAVVKKEKIKEYFNAHNISDERLLSIADTIINNKEYSEKARKRDKNGNIIPATNGKYKYTIDGIDFCHSTQLYESPVNVILSREVYRKLADINLIIKQ